MKIFYHIGKYALLMKMVFSKPEKPSVYRKLIIMEMNSIGIGSLGIVGIISIFMGAVITIQSAFGFDSPWIPIYAVGFATRESIILEFAPTIVSLILAGIVGSKIASELGTMRVNEQIDALDIMGVNSAAYLIMPKVIASLIVNPFLIIISMFLSIFGGWFFGIITGVVTSYEYIYGIQYQFKPFNVTYAIIKTIAFAFIISSVSSYHGYYTQGGSREVGVSSTKAVVYTIIAILIFNLLITQLLLS